MPFEFHYGHFESPLRFQFSHASAKRQSTENILVRCTGEHGFVGYGEGCPRSYVTGESIESTVAFVQSHSAAFSESVTSLQDLQNWISQNSGIINTNPAAFCAMELALLDCLSQQHAMRIEQFLNLPALSGNYPYTAVVGDSSLLKTRLTLLAYRTYGFKNFKIKLSGNLEHDRQRLSHIPKQFKVRIDANNLWQSSNETVDYINALSHPIWAIEEPVAALDYESLAKIITALNVPVILDESLYSQEHLTLASKHLTNAIVNIRVSKCGGILRSVDLANQCIAAGFPVILGAQVGETSLLTRAALAVGCGLKQPPIAREGAYGTILLKHDVCQPSLRFGRLGVLRSAGNKIFERDGFGLVMQTEDMQWTLLN